MSPRGRLARAVATAGLVLGVLLGAAGAASAHPLGNFSTNHLTVVRVSADRVDVRYVLDQAEIPTFRERGTAPATVLARKRAEAAGGLRLSVAGRAGGAARTRAGPHQLPDRPGRAADDARRASCSPRASATRGAVVVRDGSFPGRVGWRAVVVRPGEGTAVRSSVPSTDPTRGLRSYPGDLLDEPADRRVARLSVSPGLGTVSGARRRGQLRGRARPLDLRGAERRLRRRRRRPGRPRLPAAGRVRVGRAARALAGTRQGDGRRLPRRHAGNGARRGGARGDRHRDPHDRRLRPGAGDARAVGLRAARAALPVAEPGLGPARAARRGRRPARTRPRRAGRARARPSSPPRPRTTATTTTTTTITTTITARLAPPRRASCSRWAPRPA